MEKKKVLIVSRSFYPRNSPRSFRTTELVKEFSRMGLNVTLLTHKNDEFHIPFEKEHGVRIKDLGTSKFPKINSSTGSRTLRFLKRAVRRGLNLLFEYPDIELMFSVENALKKESGYDLMISIAAPHPTHWGVSRAIKKGYIPAKKWIADCGDPFMGTTMDTFSKMFYFKYFEKSFCRNADVITVPFEGAKDAYYSEFRNKIEVIPQGFNFSETDIDETAYKPHSIPTFAYAGGFIPGRRDPSEFLEYLVDWDKEYKFIVYTKHRHMISPYAQQADGKIEARDYIPRKELLTVLSKMDFLINFENSSSTALPSKLIDYYLTGRPVLSMPSTGIDKDKINEFLNGNYRQQVDFQDVDRYRIENVCRRFLAL